MTCASFIFFAAVRIAQPSPGLAVDDLIVYTHDVTEFGADRQGKADSTSAIQAALDDCKKAQGGTVYLPRKRTMRVKRHLGWELRSYNALP